MSFENLELDTITTTRLSRRPDRANNLKSLSPAWMTFVQVGIFLRQWFLESGWIPGFRRSKNPAGLKARA